MSVLTIPPTLGRDDVFILTTQDGSNTLFSRKYQATYHSIFGAVAESRHVFIQCGLNFHPSKKRISILEFGFGTGLNALLAFKFSKQEGKEIDYMAIESDPVSSDIAQQLDYPAYLNFSQGSKAFTRFHTEDSFSVQKFHFRKISSLDELTEPIQFDCIFFDAFAPSSQPELWEQSIFDRLFQLTASEGCLVTYCAQGEVRRRMIHAGYKVERLPGPPGKREMLRAVKNQA